MSFRRIALVGTASSGSAAPFNDKSYEIWGVSARASYVTRADRWFELHRLEGEPKAWADSWRNTIRSFSHDIPEVLMMYPEYDLAPKVTPYPYDRIVARFGTYFMTSTFSWMMALAIDELRPVGGAAVDGEIAIFGVDMEYGTEYRQQRNGFRHFIDLAHVLGISVSRMATGGLAFEPVPYPMWQDDPLLCKLEYRNKEAREKLAQIEKAQRTTCTLIAQNRAILDEIERFGDGYDKDKRRASVEKELAGLMRLSSDASRDIVYHQAVSDEQAWFRDYLSQ